MVKLKYAVVFLLFGLFSTIIVAGATPTSNYAIELNDNFSYIESLLLESSRYTQMDENDPAILDNYHANFTLSYTSDELTFLGYEIILEDDDLRVYFEMKSFSVVILNKQTGYFWSSRPEFQHVDNQPEGVAIRNQMNSGIWVESVRVLNNAKVPMQINDKSIVTESLYRIAGVAYANDDYLIANFPELCPTGFQSSNLCPQIIIPERYDEDAVKVTKTSETATTLTTEIDVKEYGFKFNVTLSLENGEFKAFVDNDSIIESDDRFKLTGLYLFPYLGSTRGDTVPGYFVIPDGVGALVRLNKSHNDTYQSRFYGSDMGYNSYTSSQLGMPIYGVVHEVGENAFYANVTEGDAQSILYAGFYGSNSRYNYIHTKFVLRELYTRIINAQGGGSLTLPTTHINQNYEVTYNFLSNSDASYVGIAKDYRDYLTGIGVLTEMTEKEQDVNLNLSFLMSDTEPAFIGTRSIRMTRIKDVLDIYETIKAAGITNQSISLSGWSKDGYGVGLARTKLNERSGTYKDLSEALEADGNQAYLVNNYVIGNESKRVNYISDVSRTISRLKMTYTNISFTGSRSEIDILYPSKSFTKAENDVNFYENLGYGVEIQDMGDVLFSYYNDSIKERTVSLETYQNLVGLFDNLMLSNPNMYLWANTDAYLNMAVTNSQFNFYSDLVPLLPIVLAGSMEMYTSYLNFNALGGERLLMMIDFGLNPSYILTEADTYKMRYTKSNMYYTTAYSDYEAEIIEDYHFLNDALKYVRGYYIEDRIVIASGVVKITYSNDVSIYINYGDKPYINDGLVLFGKSYEVMI